MRFRQIFFLFLFSFNFFHFFNSNVIFKIFFIDQYFFLILRSSLNDNCPELHNTFCNSFLSAFYTSSIRKKERLETYYSLNLAFHINLLYKMHLSRESISHRKTRFEFRAFAFAFETQPWPGAKNSFCDSISSDWAGYRPIYCIFNGNFSKKEREWGNDRIDMRKSLWGGNPWSVIRSRPRHKAKSC